MCTSFQAISLSLKSEIHNDEIIGAIPYNSCFSDNYVCIVTNTGMEVYHQKIANENLVCKIPLEYSVIRMSITKACIGLMV